MRAGPNCPSDSVEARFFGKSDTRFDAGPLQMPGKEDERRIPLQLIWFARLLLRLGLRRQCTQNGALQNFSSIYRTPSIRALESKNNFCRHLHDPRILRS